MWFRKFCLFIFCFTVLSCSNADPIFHDNNNHVIKFSELKGKWVILNYWADWCGYCVKEIPELNNFYLHNRDKNVVLFGVNFDELSPDTLKSMIKRADIVFPVLMENPNQVYNLGEVSVLPTTFIINPNGMIVKKITGTTSEESLKSDLNALQ